MTYFFSGSGYELHLPGGLCGPGLLQPRDADAAVDAEGQVAGPDNAPEGQPRVPADHAGLRVLR